MIPTSESYEIKSLELLLQDILASKDEYVCLDTETTGLRWMAGHKAFGVAIAWDNKAVFIRMDDFPLDKIALLISDIYDSRKTITFHNAEFDLHMLRVTLGVETLPRRILDTLRVSHLLDSGGDHSLKGWGSKVFGAAVSYYEDTLVEYRKRYKIKDYSMIPSSVLDPYACNDVVLTKALAERFVPITLRDCPRLLELEHDLIPVIVEMERGGLKLDLEYIAERRKMLARKKNDLEKKIFGLVRKPLNLGSPKQISEYFYNRQKVVVTDSGGNPTGETGTGEEFLEAIQLADPKSTSAQVANLILQWRKVEKDDSTYMEPYQELQVNGRLHPHWNACGTITGRFSGSNPNPQNIPRNSDVRRCFIPDVWFVDFDYSQIEYRMAAFASKEVDMIQAFVDGLDFHAYTASKIWEKPIESIIKDERTIGKTINFLTLYGGGAEKFAKTANIGVPEAEEYLQAYWTANANLRAYTRKMIADGQRNGYVYTLFGRKIPIDRARAYAAPNYIIQGTAGDILKISLVRTAAIAKELGVSIRNTVHDQIVFDGLEFSDIPRMVETMEAFTFKDERSGLSMPVIIDVKDGGKSWGDMGDEWTSEEKYSGEKGKIKKPAKKMSKTAKRKLQLD